MALLNYFHAFFKYFLHFLMQVSWHDALARLSVKYGFAKRCAGKRPKALPPLVCVSFICAT